MQNERSQKQTTGLKLPHVDSSKGCEINSQGLFGENLDDLIEGAGPDMEGGSTRMRVPSDAVALAAELNGMRLNGKVKAAVSPSRMNGLGATSAGPSETNSTIGSDDHHGGLQDAEALGTDGPNAKGEVADDDTDDDDDDDSMEPVAGEVRIAPSLFPRRQGTIFFDYPKHLEMRRASPFVVEELRHKTLKYKMYWERNCVKNAFQRAGFKRTTTSTWNAAWAKHPTNDQFRSMNRFQKVNHFPGSWCIGRKDRLLRTLFKLRRAHGPEAFGFFPEGYILPGERASLLRALQNDASLHPKTCDKLLWIIKPVASSCGRGIKVLNRYDVQDLKRDKKAVVTRYVSNPYLVDGRKCDLRLYVLCSSIDPLQVYLFEEGLTRFCTKKYNRHNIKSRYGHLTNYSINKNSKNFESNEDADNDMTGSKWSLTAFWRYLEETEGSEACHKVQCRTKELIVKTMIAAEEEIVPNVHRFTQQRGVCFELFGFDVLLDDKLKPWIIEVNISPSLMGSSPLDKKIKGMLVADIFHLIGFIPYDKKQIKKENQMEAEDRRLKTVMKKKPEKIKKKHDEWRKSSMPRDIKLEDLNDDEWDVIFQFEDEQNRRGHFECIYPERQMVSKVWPFFCSPRLNNGIIAKWLQTGGLHSRKNRILTGVEPAGSPKSRRGGSNTSAHSNLSDNQSKSTASLSISLGSHRSMQLSMGGSPRKQSARLSARKSLGRTASTGSGCASSRGRQLQRGSAKAQDALRTSLIRKPSGPDSKGVSSQRSGSRGKSAGRQRGGQRRLSVPPRPVSAKQPSSARSSGIATQHPPRRSTPMSPMNSSRRYVTSPIQSPVHSSRQSRNMSPAKLQTTTIEMWNPELDPMVLHGAYNLANRVEDASYLPQELRLQENLAVQRSSKAQMASAASSQYQYTNSSEGGLFKYSQQQLSTDDAILRQLGGGGW